MTRGSKSYLYPADDAHHFSIETEIAASNELSSRSQPPADPIRATGPSGEQLTLDTLPSFNTGCRVIPFRRDQHWPMGQGLWPQAIQNPIPSKIIFDVVKVWWPEKLEG